MSATFGLETVSHATIRENIEEHVVRIANELRDNLNDKAMAIFLQRVVGSFVGAAHGAAIFYGNKKSDALRLNTRLLNDARDEDRDGMLGFESKAAAGRRLCRRDGPAGLRPLRRRRGRRLCLRPHHRRRVEALRDRAADRRRRAEVDRRDDGGPRD